MGLIKSWGNVEEQNMNGKRKLWMSEGNEDGGIEDSWDLIKAIASENIAENTWLDTLIHIGNSLKSIWIWNYSIGPHCMHVTHYKDYFFELLRSGKRSLTLVLCKVSRRGMWGLQGCLDPNESFLVRMSLKRISFAYIL